MASDSEYTHPMRDVVFHAYVRQDGEKAIVRGEPYGLCPMLFEGDSADVALERAETFRAETVAQNEAAHIARKRRAAEAAAKRKAKANV